MVTHVRRHGQRRRARRGDGDLLREDILCATEKLLLRTKDVDAVSIRAVADAVGVTPPSIYMHFASKEELILEVCGRQFEAFDAYLAAAQEGIDDPADAIRAMGRAYVRFGLDHPEQYRFLFMSATPEWAVREKTIEDLSGFYRVMAAAERCVQAGVYAPGDPFAIACGLWTAVHGVTSLLIANPHFPWPPIEQLVEQGIDVHCRGLRNP